MIENDEDLIFVIGKETSQFLKIKIEAYSYPDSMDYWDGNWLNSEITINAGAFKANYSAQFRNTDFIDFRIGLENIYKNLQGSAQFVTMEDYLSVKIEGDGLGHFYCDCLATDDPSSVNRLNFSLTFDQTEIPILINAIDKILIDFPVRDIENMPNT